MSPVGQTLAPISMFRGVLINWISWLWGHAKCFSQRRFCSRAGATSPGDTPRRIAWIHPNHVGAAEMTARERVGYRSSHCHHFKRFGEGSGILTIGSAVGIASFPMGHLHEGI